MGQRATDQSVATIPAYKRSRRERKKMEMLLAPLKRILKLDRMRPRGPSSAPAEFLMAATAQNLRRIAIRLMATGEQNEIAIAWRATGPQLPQSSHVWKQPEVKFVS